MPTVGEHSKPFSGKQEVMHECFACRQNNHLPNFSHFKTCSQLSKLYNRYSQCCSDINL